MPADEVDAEALRKVRVEGRGPEIQRKEPGEEVFGKEDVFEEQRLVAGDARDGGGARILPTVDQIDRGLVLCVAGARAYLVVVAAAAGTA